MTMRETLMKIRLLTFTCVCLVLPSAASGQTVLDWTGYDSETCQAAVERVQEQAPSQERAQALWELRLCGPGGAQALAGELVRLSTSSDEGALQGAYGPMAGLRDAVILDTALRLAANTDAALAARITAIRLLVSYEGAGNPFPTLASFTLGAPAELVVPSGPPPLEGAPLPPGWERVAREALTAIVESPANRGPVAQAARWAASYFRG